jgi:molecular chaperone DnaK
LVGKLAKNKAILSPTNVLYEIKRFIGRKYDEVKEEIKNLPYQVKK